MNLRGRVIIKAFKTQNGTVNFDAILSPPKYIIDPVLSLQCRAVRMVPLMTFGVPVMTPAESPQDRRRPKMTDHILAILSARDGHGRWSGPDQDHARRSTCLPGHCTALAWPGGAVVVVVMAPVEGKNAKMTKSLSGSRTVPGHFRDSYVIKFELFSELLILRAHAAHCAACALQL